MTREQDLTDEERSLLEFTVRCEIALNKLGANSLARLLVSFLLLDGEGLSQASLAQVLGVPRSTLRPRIEMNIQGGNLEIRDNGVHLTDAGRQITLSILRQAAEIARGERTGFGKKLIDYFAQHPDTNHNIDAETVAFPRQ